MLPHKQHRGKAALDRMKCFEGMPAPYDKQKRMVIPAALKVMRMKPRRRVSFLHFNCNPSWINKVATAQGISLLFFPDRENTRDFVVTQERVYGTGQYSNFDFF